MLVAIILNILKTVFENDKVKIPLLPCPVDLMNQAQLLAYTIPELKLDYILYKISSLSQELKSW